MVPGMDAQLTEPFQSRTVSFVRRDNRLRPRLQRTWDEHHETWVLDVPRVQASMSVAPGHLLDAVRDFGREAPLVVEIGSGTGDAVIEGAQASPGTNFLAVEVYRPGMAATLAKIVRHELTNVRLVQADAVQVLEHMLGRGSVAELAASRLQPGGTLRLSTDWADYARQMRDVLTECDSLTNPHDPELTNRGTGFAPRFEGRVMTRFEQKAMASGNTVYDLELHRIPQT